MTTATATTPETQPATADSESAEQPQSLISLALQKRKEWIDNDANEKRDCRESAVARYLELLNHDENPRDGDARDLAQVMYDMEIDEEVVIRDLKLIKRARRFERLRADLDAAHKASVTTRDEHRALIKRCEQEEVEACKKKDTAVFHHRQCVEADHDLKMLRRQRPLLFTDPEDPPVRLLETITIE